MSALSATEEAIDFMIADDELKEVSHDGEE
jgi:hypothetical protein